MKSKTTETWVRVGTSSAGRKSYQISNLGRCKVINNTTGEVIISRGRKNQFTGYLVAPWGGYVHRSVAQAFLKKPRDPAMSVVSHLNTIKEDCRACNLEWATTATNNRNHLTNLKRAASYHHQRHDGQMLRGTKNGETRFWKTYTEAARYIGCSHVLCVNACLKRQSARLAKGWSLEWIDVKEICK